MVRVVDGVGVAGAHGGAAPPDDLLDAGAHRAEVDGDVRGVGHQVPVRVEEGAGEVQPFLDVDGLGGGLQAGAHLFGDGHEEVVEDLQQDRVDLRVRLGPLRDGHAFHDEVSVIGGRGLPAVVDDGRGAVLGDDRGAGDGLAGREVLAAVEGDVAPGAAGVEADGDGCGGPARPGGEGREVGGSVVPVASTERASTTTGRSRVKE